MNQRVAKKVTKNKENNDLKYHKGQIDNAETVIRHKEKRKKKKEATKTQ